jgi:predicted Zn-dependent protease with MMP-like domain
VIPAGKVKPPLPYNAAVIRVNRREFQELVRKALSDLPEEFARAVENVAVVVEEEPSAEDLESVGLDPEHDDLFGLYQGVPLPERGMRYEALPDRIAIYRQPILWACDTREQVVAEVRTTVIHELGHYFGLPDSELPA